MQVAITRSPEQLAGLTETAAQRNISIVPLPVTRIVPVSFQWPDNLPVDQIDWLVFTSANGVIHFFDRLRKLQVGLSRNMKIAAVGDKTADALGKQGWKIAFVPREARGDVLFAELADRLTTGSIVVYPQAETIAGDPEPAVRTSGGRYVPIVCYRSVEQPLDGSIVERLEANDLILFTAPSSVRAFGKQFGAPNARVLAIGSTTAAAIAELGWPHHVMKEANIDTVLEYV